MRGLAATVTSCIGGKDEKFAVQVRPEAPASVYFVYKTIGEFDALWGSLETLARDVKRPTNSQNKPKDEKKPSLLAKWLASVVDHYAFRQIIRDLRAQEKETMSTLNVLLQFLVARVSALFVERSLLHSCTVGRQLVTIVRDFLQQPVAATTKTEKLIKTTPPSTKDGRNARSRRCVRKTARNSAAVCFLRVAATNVPSRRRSSAACANGRFHLWASLAWLHPWRLAAASSRKWSF
eukprot:jgi/Phyca11/507554/fgenesh2_kg.PHYCAscaffold_28_\